MTIDCSTDERWLAHSLKALREVGYAVVQGVLDAEFLTETRAALYRVQQAIVREVGEERLARTGELGVLRLMMKFEPHFLKFLELPQLLAVVDATVSATSIMHLQNGFIFPSFPTGQGPTVFQNSYHQDFPRVLGGYVASVNAFFAIDEFSITNGATFVLPGSHQNPATPDRGSIEARAVPLECEAGSMVVFDSTLWHSAGSNVSGKDRLALNHQFTRSFIKQQIDYVRALGPAVVQTTPPRTQQLLGWYTRVVTSLDEYYQPEEARLYRKGQG